MFSRRSSCLRATRFELVCQHLAVAGSLCLASWLAGFGSLVVQAQIAPERKAATLRLLSSSQRSAAGHPDPLLAQVGDAAGDRDTADAPTPDQTPTPERPGPAAGQAPGPGGGQGPRGGFGQRPGGGAGGPGGQGAVDGEGVSLQFPLNPVSDLLTIYEELIGKTIVKDTSIFDGPQVSLVTPGRVPHDEAVRLIEMTLVTNGYVIVSEPGEDSVKILLGRPRQQSQSSSFSEGIVIYTEPEALPVGESLVGFFLKLNNIGPDEAAAILGNHVVLNEYGRITPVANPPGLLVTESSAIVRQLIQLRAIIDVAPQDASLLTQFVQLQYADANTVAQIIQAAVDARAEEALRLSEAGRTITGQRPSGDNNQRSSNNSNQRAPTPTSSRTSQSNNRAPDLSGSGIGTADQPAAQLIADDRLNRIMVVASPADTGYILDLIQQFDQPLDTPEPVERQLRYAKANDILPVIVDVLQDTGTGTTNLPGGRQIDTRPTPVVSSQLSALTGATAGQNNQAATRTTQTGVDATGRPDQLAFPIDDVAPISVLVGKTRIIADRLANSIIVMGPGESQKIVLDIIDRLDRRPSQVYLATVIGQLQLGDDFEFGIDYLLKFTEFDGGDPSQGGIAGQSINSRSDIITGGNIADVRDSIITSAFGPIDGLNVYGQIGENLDVFVNALERSGRFKVLSRPVVFTQNGKRAEITSGERVPVPETSLTDGTNAANNAAVSTTITFEDVVLKLEVVPTINADGEVTLEIVQINDTVTGTQIVANNEVPIISTQELNTTVTVPDRNTLVLGGLITEQESTTDQGLPWISKVPVLGPLTTSTVEQKEREELIIFIQPIVVFNSQDTLEASYDEDLRTEVGEDAAAVFPQEAPALPVRMPEPKGKRRFFGLLPPARPDPEVENELIPVPDGRRYQDENAGEGSPSYQVPAEGESSGEAGDPNAGAVPGPVDEKKRSGWFSGFRR